MNEITAIRLMLVDDHDVVRQGLKTLLERRPGITVVGEAATVAESVEEARRCRPDIIVMDVRLPDGTGIEACREIRAENPSIRVVMLTSYADEDAVIAAILAGASGYLLKQTRARALVDAIEVVAKGGSMLDPIVADQALARIRAIASGELTSEERQLASLTEQERRILPLIADGKTNKEIAEILFLSDKTIKNYVSSILEKLGLSRRAQAAAFSARLKDPNDPSAPSHEN